jgi:hypothetical protein
LGLKPSVGYDVKTQKITTERIAQSELKKKTRKIKKEQRKARRAERKLKREQKKAEKAAEATP